MAQNAQQNPEQVGQTPAKSGFRIFAGKLLKGLLIGAAVAAAVGGLCLFPAIGVPVATALHGIPVLGSLVGAHSPAALFIQTHPAFAAAMHIHAITALHTTATVAWGALLGAGAAAGALFGSIVGAIKGERQHKVNKMEQTRVKAQEQERSPAPTQQQSMAQEQGTSLDNIPDTRWQQRVINQRQQQTSASLPPF